jgi:hypothetical protein
MSKIDRKARALAVMRARQLAQHWRTEAAAVLKGTAPGTAAARSARAAMLAACAMELEEAVSLKANRWLAAKIDTDTCGKCGRGFTGIACPHCLPVNAAQPTARKVLLAQICEVLASYDAGIITEQVALGHIARIVDYMWQRGGRRPALCTSVTCPHPKPHREHPGRPFATEAPADA